jgi:hypothetical protein
MTMAKLAPSTSRPWSPRRAAALLPWALASTAVVAGGATQTIGFETCPARATLADVECAGIAQIGTSQGSPIAIPFPGRHGTTGTMALMPGVRGTGPLTITFTQAVTRVSLDMLEPGVGAMLQAFDANDVALDLDQVAAATTNQTLEVAAPGIARIVVSDPDFEFGIDQLSFDPVGSVRGCGNNDGCIVDPCSIQYRIGGSLSRLPTGMSITLANNGDSLVLNANGPFQFTNAQFDQSAYSVVITSQPGGIPGLCSVTAGNGSLDGGDVGDVAVQCDAYHVGTATSGSGSIAPATTQTVVAGTTLQFTLTPQPGNQILSVSGCNGSLVGNVYTTGSIQGDCEVTALFGVDDVFENGFE